MVTLHVSHHFLHTALIAKAGVGPPDLEGQDPKNKEVPRGKLASCCGPPTPSSEKGLAQRLAGPRLLKRKAAVHAGKRRAVEQEARKRAPLWPLRICRAVEPKHWALKQKQEEISLFLLPSCLSQAQFTVILPDPPLVPLRGSSLTPSASGLVTLNLAPSPHPHFNTCSCLHTCISSFILPLSFLLIHSHNIL